MGEGGEGTWSLLCEAEILLHVALDGQLDLLDEGDVLACGAETSGEPRTQNAGDVWIEGKSAPLIRHAVGESAGFGQRLNGGREEEQSNRTGSRCRFPRCDVLVMEGVAVRCRLWCRVRQGRCVRYAVAQCECAFINGGLLPWCVSGVPGPMPSIAALPCSW